MFYTLCEEISLLHFHGKVQKRPDIGIKDIRGYILDNLFHTKNELVCSSTYTKLLQNYWTIFNFNQRNLDQL